MIEGLWVLAEGIVYAEFSKEKHVIENYTPENTDEYYISIDYGTKNPTSMGLWCLKQNGHAIRIRESYYDGRKKGHSRTDEEHYVELERLAGDLADKIRYIVVDPSAASFIECIYRHGKFRVYKADNSVLDGIRDTATLLHLGYLQFDKSCKDSIREFSLYRWDDKAQGDKVIKENDHAMDDIRYFVRTVMWRSLKEIRRGEKND